MDLRVPIEGALAAFGLPATVTPDGGSPVETTAIWLPYDTVESPPAGDFRRAEPRRVLALPFEGLPQVPRGTIVTVEEFSGAGARDWRVDAANRVDHDHYRCIVLPA